MIFIKKKVEDSRWDKELNKITYRKNLNTLNENIPNVDLFTSNKNSKNSFKNK